MNDNTRIQPFQCLVVDDDVDAARLLDLRLRRALPGCQVTVETEPGRLAAHRVHDVYLVDNEFGSEPLGATLARELRAAAPSSLIIAFSGHLDRGSLKDLLNAGCDLAVEKGAPHELEQMLRTIGEFVAGPGRAAADQRRGFLPAVNSLLQLVRELNRRLDRQARQEDVA